MFDLKTILLIILICVCIYLIYKLYSHNSFILNKASETIMDNMDDQFEELNEKLVVFEELFTSKINECNKKVNDLYSMQNKVNEITKMNNQSILHQINQYDEEEELDKNNVIYNSVEASTTQPLHTNNKDLERSKNCFIKINDAKNQEKDKEMFYMSSENKHKKHDKDDGTLFLEVFLE